MMSRKSSGSATSNQPNRLISKTLGNPVLRQNCSSLMATSRDEAEAQFLSMSKRSAFDMDCVKTTWVNKCNQSDHAMKSVDALFTDADTLYLVEFKNGSQRNILAHDIHEKILSSIIILTDLLSCTCSHLRPHVVFLYVYQSKATIHEHLKNKAKNSNRSGENDKVQTVADRYTKVLYREGDALSGTQFDEFVRTLE